MVDVASEAKRLTLYLGENEERYITGELDLEESLEKTDELYRKTLADSDNVSGPTANKILHDSHLMKVQSRIARQCAKHYKPDSLAFNATEFSIKLAQYYGQPSTSQKATLNPAEEELFWMKIGDVAKKLLYTVPSFNFIYGTFDPDPIEHIKKKRKMKEKDKLGALTKPESMSLKDSTGNQDIMIKETQRVFSFFTKLCKKNNVEWICYFEFVTDPTSFSKTVENIFIVSLLVKEACVCIVKDQNGSPYLARVTEENKKERKSAVIKQCIVSLTKEDWQDIVRTFNFKKPLLPPRKSISHGEANSEL